MAGLADAAGPGEQIGMGDAVAFEGIDQHLRDRFLADQIAELLRPIAAGQDRVLGGPGSFRFHWLRSVSN